MKYPWRRVAIPLMTGRIPNSAASQSLREASSGSNACATCPYPKKSRRSGDSSVSFIKCSHTGQRQKALAILCVVMSQQEKQHGNQHKQDDNRQKKEPDWQSRASDRPIFTG